MPRTLLKPYTIYKNLQKNKDRGACFKPASALAFLMPFRDSRSDIDFHLKLCSLLKQKEKLPVFMGFCRRGLCFFTFQPVIQCREFHILRHQPLRAESRFLPLGTASGPQCRRYGLRQHIPHPKQTRACP